MLSTILMNLVFIYKTELLRNYKHLYFHFVLIMYSVIHRPIFSGRKILHIDVY